MRKILSLFLIVLLLFCFSGCGAGKGANAGGSSSKGATADDSGKKLKVALCLEGPVNDGEWNTYAYEGLLEIKKNYDADVSYFEMIKKSDMEEVIRNYALQGYDVIFGHGFTFGDPMAKIAKEFPDTIFIVNSSENYNDKNLASISIDGKQQGFIAGAVAALVSETGKVGIIGGMEIPPVSATLEGFTKGSKYINSDVEVLTAFSGNFEDAAAVKELMKAFIDKKVDVGMAVADAASMGAIEALQEKGLHYVGSNQKQIEMAPKTVVLSVSQSYPDAMNYVFKEIYEDRFKPSVYNVGISAGAVTISENPDYKVDKAIKEKIDEITSKLLKGEIKL